MGKSISLENLSREQLEMLAADALGKGKKTAKKGKSQKGPTYGGASMGDIMSQFNEMGAGEVLERYGRNPDIKWGY